MFKILVITPLFHIKDVKNINKIGIKTIKIPSGEINNLPYLKYIGKQKKNIITKEECTTIINNYFQALQAKKTESSNAEGSAFLAEKW